MENKLNLTRSQKSKRILDENIDDPIFNEVRAVNGGWVSRFVNDFVISILREPHNKSLKIQIDPVNDAKEKLIADALSPGASDLESAVRNFFKYCISNIVAFGQAVYEIVFFSDDDGRIMNFELEHIYPPKTVIGDENRIYQYIPGESQHIELSPESIIFFRLPENLNDKIEEVRNNLFYLDSHPSIDFKSELIEAGKSINWNPGFWQEPKQWTDNNLFSYLEFERFVIEIREYLLDLLNKHLQNICAQLGFTAQIKIEGLISMMI
jgi:hypothetical protein